MFTPIGWGGKTAVAFEIIGAGENGRGILFG